MLAAEFGVLQSNVVEAQTVSTAPITWFETVAGVSRIPLTSLATVDRSLPEGVAGPVPLAAGEWIVQLRADAARAVRQLAQADALLDDLNNDFTIISGLGARGALLVRGEGASRLDIESSLRGNPQVQFFQLNQLILGQTTSPNESDFAAGLLPGLTKIDAPTAWGQSLGSMNTVVGVVDSGIDPTHQDLYLNIWLNQGELPKRYLEGVGNRLVDVDGDGLITFYDLNNLKRTPEGIVVASTGTVATQAELTTATPFSSGENRHFVRDLNGNGRIDARDLLLDANWADGRDDDGNGFFDDLFGVNFRAGVGDPFPRNNPSDELGHGTHVAGTIGAIGDNGTGVVGVNWQTSLMSLRILDNNNQGDSSAAILAMNYARAMRAQYRTGSDGRVVAGANVRVLNNSWGQPGGYEPSVEAAIAQLHEAGILVVAAAGNGNILGNGVDNDRTPFYPASYDVPNVIAVAASDANDRLAAFSNFGKTSVDILAPGVGIRSTVPGGGYQNANGTSMAAPHVAGTAALIWSALPEATVSEVKHALLSSAPPVPDAALHVSSGGRLNAAAALNAEVFAPAARLISKSDILSGGGTETDFTVEYFHRGGIDTSTIGDGDLLISRQWGPVTPTLARLVPGSVVSENQGTTVRATYTVPAPGEAGFSGLTAVEKGIEIKTVSNTTPVEIRSNAVSTIESQIVVSDFTEMVGPLSLVLDIQHTFTSDLQATLITPSATRIKLFSGVGGAGDDFRQTALSDDATIGIAQGAAPFTGFFRPEEAFADLVGMDPNGTWTLEIEDRFSADGGQLDGWSLRIPQRMQSVTSVTTEVLVDGVLKLDPQFTVTAEFRNLPLTDVTAYLVAPSGERLRLFSDLSAESSPSMIVVFDDAASTALPATTLTAGLYRSQDSLQALAAKVLNGNWKLELEGDIGLNDAAEVRWSIDFSNQWDPLDYGQYLISTVPEEVRTINGNLPIEQRSIGAFSVRIEDPRVRYVTATQDLPSSESLRDAILAANSAGTPTTILLDHGHYVLDVQPERTQANTFLQPSVLSQCAPLEPNHPWSDATTGDFDITGNVSIVGSSDTQVVIDAQGLDRVFKVHPNAFLHLERLTVTGGRSPANEGGGGILSAGQLSLRDVNVRENIALGENERLAIRGGGIAVWDGEAFISRSWITDNQADYGGGVFYCGAATGLITQTTISGNQGGGLHSHAIVANTITNSTLSGNIGGQGAIFNGRYDGFGLGDTDSTSAAISGDGRFIAFKSASSTLVPGDNNGEIDIFLYDRLTESLERISVNNDGQEANAASGGTFQTGISLSEDGRYIAYVSRATNLAPSAGAFENIFVYDRIERKVEHVSVGNNGLGGIHASSDPSISADGRFVAFATSSPLEPTDTGLTSDIYVYDRHEQEIERISRGIHDELPNGNSNVPVISADGKFVAYRSRATNLVEQVTTAEYDHIYLYERATGLTQRLSESAAGEQANARSGDFFGSGLSVSGDGNLVAFSSYATNLIAETAGGSTSTSRVFVYNRSANTRQIVSRGHGGVLANSSAENPTISRDGRWVLFRSSAALVEGVSGFAVHVYARDLEENKIYLISRNDAGAIANHHSGALTNSNGSIGVSNDGSFIAYASGASNLNAQDHNGKIDIFVTNRSSGLVKPVSLYSHPSALVASQVTIAEHVGTRHSVSGRVALEDTLFARNDVLGELGPRIQLAGVVRQLTASEATTLSPLTSRASGPPVHYPQAGSPAIDSGTAKFAGTLDQLGNRRNLPDLGAVEAVNGALSGFVYADSNRNQTRDASERLLPDLLVELVQGDQVLSRVTSSPAPGETAGAFAFTDLQPEDYLVRVQVPDHWDFSQPAIVRVQPRTLQPNGLSQLPVLSGDGRFVAFMSDASNLVESDQNARSDVFVFDRLTGMLDRVSVDDQGKEGTFGSGWEGNRRAISISADGRWVAYLSTSFNEFAGDNQELLVFDRQERKVIGIENVEGVIADSFSGSPMISGDGKFVAFYSFASNLTAAGNEDSVQLYRREMATGKVVLISRSTTNTAGDANSGFNGDFSISHDGQRVAFASDATNLVAEADSNNASDVFVYDAVDNLLSRVSVSTTGVQADAGSGYPSISANGRYVAFESSARNLHPSATTFSTKIFVRDLLDNKTDLITTQGSKPSISGDGRYVVFESSAALVAGDVNGKTDIYVYDRVTKRLAIVSTSEQGVAANDNSQNAIVSQDGRFITFTSDAMTLVANDTNSRRDVFVVSNPLLEPGIYQTVVAGDQLTNLAIGLVPRPGNISGRLFEDSLIGNGIYDAGEPGLANAVVFIDENRNGVLDANERQTLTNAEGVYQFQKLSSHQDYVLRAIIPPGLEQITPRVGNATELSLFLSAGADITERDFGFRAVQTTGQSSRSEIHGRLFVDKNGTGKFDDGDEPIVGAEVFLDASNFGVRDEDELRTLTDAQGLYSFDGLSARNVAVTTVLDETLVHVNPLGNEFSLGTYPLFGQLNAFTNPQAIAAGDFSGNELLDIAVALGDSDQLIIRYNDGNGGFLPEEINIDLGTNGARPTSLVIGKFDDDERLDVALTANSTGYVTVLLNFDPLLKEFASIEHVKVGDEPLDIAAGNFTGNENDLFDLVVVNKADNTVQLLDNNGSGVFTARPGVPTGGRNASSIVVGNFTQGTTLDVAVVHASARVGANTPFGDVTVLRGDGSGGLTLQPQHYTVGGTPSDAVVADFNRDHMLDLAVVNFATKSISILLGQEDGTFRVQETVLGTAQGTLDIAIGDIDNDGDIDIFASNLEDRNISIFRNDGPDPVTGEVRFQPLENVGLANAKVSQRMPMVVGNFDNDRSGPGSSGTIDIVTVLNSTGTGATTMLNVLKNTLVNGAHRVALTGRPDDVRTGLDFIIKPAILPPSFSAIANPLPIFEDAAVQTITISGITKGRATGPLLQFTATSSNPALIAAPAVTYTGGTTATVDYTPLLDMSGTTIITVRAVDAGADALFGGEDDGIFERSFTVSVLAVNDPPVFDLLAEASAKQTDGATTIPNFVTAIGKGGGDDEDSQTLDPLVVIASDTSFFTVQPAIDAGGTLTFTPNPNKSGSVPVTVTLKDSGGRTNGGVDTTTKTFLVNVGPVNDPPSFTLMANPNRSVVQTAGPQTFADFVVAFLPGGGADEASQVVSDYLVTVDAPGIFTVLPDISNAGTLTFTPASDRTGVATVSVQVRDSGGRASGGNDLSAVTTFTIAVTAAPDVTRPTPVISYVGAALTNQTTFDIEVDFKEALAAGEFILSELTVSRGTTANLRDLGGGKYLIGYTSGGDGAVTFGVAANVASDLAGNLNFAATSVVRTIDTLGITPTLRSSVPAISSATSFVVDIDFAEPTFGFTLTDLVVLSGTASNLQTVDVATGKYNVTITPTADGTVTVLLPAGAVTDAAGNSNAAATPLVRTVDRTAPLAVLSTTEPARTNQTTFEVLAEFGEEVTGLAASDLTIQGGTASVPVLVSPGRYRFTITAANGPVQIQLAANAVMDAAGNANVASNTINLTVDTAAFVPVLSSISSAVLRTNTFDVAVDFGKAVASFTTANITLSNGTASNITPVDAAAGKYSFTVTATGDGSVSVLVAAGVVKDTAGNDNSASNSLVRVIDRVAPQPTLSANVPALTQQASFVVTIDFGKAVTGFTLSDVVTTGVTLSSLQSLGDGRFTVTATSTGGPATFNLPAAAAFDLAGNASLAATPLAIAVDLSAPLPVLSTITPLLSNAASFTVAVNFGEEVVGFAISDLLLINGVASALTETDRANGSFNFVVTPGADGLTSVLLPAAAGSDKAGNLSQASGLLSRTFDRQAPVPVLTTTEPSRTNKTTFEVIANFGETVTGLTKSDFQVTGATINDPIELGNGRYAVTLSGASGVVELQLAAGAVVDAAGNNSTVSNRLSRTIDTSRILPLVSTSVPPLTSADSFTVAIDFTQPVVGFTASHMFALGGTVSDLAEVDATTGKYSVKVTPSSDGVVTLLLPANAATDLVGNGNLAAAPLVRTIDRVAPVLTLSSAQTSPALETSFTVILQSSKPISGLTPASFTVSGGSIGQPALLGDGRYSVPVTAAGGLFEISIQANAVVDAAGNANAASNTLSIEVTPRSRVITPQQTSAAIDLSVLGEQDLTGAETIDLRGQGDNLLTLDSAKIVSFFTDSTAIIYADPGDTLAFAGKWDFDAVLLVDGQIHRVFSQAGATVQVQGPYDFSNPINRFDVDASGDVAALDALNILNAIRAKLLIDADGAFVPLTEETITSFRFLDVDQNNQLAPLDALLVLIEMSRINRGQAGGEGELLVSAPLVTLARASGDEVPAEPSNIGTANGSRSRLKWVEADEAVDSHWHLPLDDGGSAVAASDDETSTSDTASLVDEAFADPLLLESY